MRLLGNIVVSGDIVCKTGLHIGVEGELEVGGIDNPVIKDPISGKPYIPGTSLKGKMRSLTEWHEGKINSDNRDDDDKVYYHQCTQRRCRVCRVFGYAAEDDRPDVGPTRLTVRDAYPTSATEKFWEEELSNALQYTEIKTETAIDRIRSTANPRQMERVPQDSRFNFEFIFSVYDTGQGGVVDVELFNIVEQARHLLKDSALGGSGSRGYGSIQFSDEEYEVRPVESYRPGGDDPVTVSDPAEIPDILGIETEV